MTACDCPPPRASRRSRLERLIDGDLPRSEADSLRDLVERDPALRAELARVERTDRLIAESLSARPRPRRSSPRAGAVRPRWLVLGGAGGLIGLGALAAVALVVRPWSEGALRPTSSHEPSSPTHVASVDDRTPPAPDARSQSGSRVLFEIAGARAPARPDDRLPAATHSSEDRPVSIDERRRIANSDERDGRAEEYLRLGRSIRSAMIAERALDELTPAEQLDAIREWVRVPSLRPVAFERLAALAHDPMVGDAALSLARALADQQDLSPWVKSQAVLRVSLH